MADGEVMFVGDGVVAGACFVERTTLLLSEQEKPFLMQRSHLVGQTRSTGIHYYSFVSICFELSRGDIVVVAHVCCLQKLHSCI